MPNIILLCAMIVLIIVYTRRKKERNIIPQYVVMTGIIVLLIFDWYLWIFEGNRFYIYESEKNNKTYENESNFSESDVIEKVNIDASVDIEIQNKIYALINSIIAFISMWLFAIFIYKFDLIKKYKINLKNDLYNIKHMWLGEKTLTDIIISINVKRNQQFRLFDICDYFEKVVRSKKRGIYLILGNAGEGKTVSVRKICSAFLCNDKKTGFQWILRKEKIRKVEEQTIIPLILNFTEIKNVDSIIGLLEIIIEKIILVMHPPKMLLQWNKLQKKIRKIIALELKRGNVILFFDGYDEVNDEQRYDLLKILSEFASIYDQCYYVITSRTAVFENSEYIQIEENKILWIVGLDKEKILEFLSRWKFKESKDKWELYEKIIYNYQLERLARNPLLLTLICFLYDHSNLSMPNSISEFYEESVACLLKSWESEKGILKRTKIDYQIKEMMLEEIAFYLFEKENEEFAYIEIENVRNMISEKCGENPKDTLLEIYLYSGLLERTKNNNYKFYHRSFYEFFLAKYFLRNKEKISQVFEKGKQVYNILFFYFAMSKESYEVEQYIIKNTKNFNVVEPLLLECTIKNIDLVREYLLEKVRLDNNRGEEYFQCLGNIAKKYPEVKELITKYFLNEFEKNIVQVSISIDVQIYIQNIILGLSYYEKSIFIVQLILKHVKNIDLFHLAANANYRLNEFLCEIFISELNDDMYKKDLIRGLKKTEKYNTILEILRMDSSEEDRKIIFAELLFATTHPLFIMWMDKQVLLDYVNENVKRKVVIWSKEYGWKWKDLSSEQIINRFILVYYFLEVCPEVSEMDKISARIKYVGTYIKNSELVREQNTMVKNYYIDLEDYEVRSLSEFAYHWKIPKFSDYFLMNPKVLRNIQIILCVGVLLVMAYLNIRYVTLYNFEQNNLSKMIHDIDNELQPSEYESYLHEYRLLMTTKEIMVSKYMPFNFNFIIFWFAWFYLQLRTYYYLAEKSYSLFYNMLYCLVGISYMTGFMFVVQNNLFRVGGAFLVVVSMACAIIQHKHNMPSFREPLFSKIKQYLEMDIL